MLRRRRKRGRVQIAEGSCLPKDEAVHQIDDACGNPSRWTRFPGGIRHLGNHGERDVCREQQLVALKQGTTSWGEFLAAMEREMDTLRLAPLKETIAEVEARRQEDPWPDSVLRYMEQNSPCSMNEILRHGVSKETEDQTIGDQRRCGAILRQHGYERSQDTSDGRPRMWRKRGAECHRRVRANAMERMHECIIREDSLWQNASNTDLLKKGWRRLPPRKKKRAYEPGDYIREHVLHLFMCYLKRPFWDRPPYPGDPTKPS